MAALEIEQKFVFEMQQIAKALTKCNAQFLGQKTFLDTYYDFKDMKLALQNVWFRQRQSTWELKSGNIPKVDPDNMKGLGTTYYVEREGPELISKELNKFDFFKNAPSFEDKLACLQPFAIIETTRTSYRINDHTKVDLDNARLIPTPNLLRKDVTNYSIGEIEIMVYKQDEIDVDHNAIVEQEFINMRKLLGVQTSIKLLSKLDRYFLEYMPEFYKTYPYHS